MHVDRFRDLYQMTLDIYDNNRGLDIFLGQGLTEVIITFEKMKAAVVLKMNNRDDAIEINLRKLVFRQCPRCNPCIPLI